MEDEGTHEVHRYAETLDDIVTADYSFGNDFLLPDMYNMCGTSSSSSALLEAASHRSPLGNLDDAVMEPYDPLWRSDHFHWLAHHTLAVSRGTGHVEMNRDGNCSVSAEPADVNDSSDPTPLRDDTHERSNSAFVEWKPGNNVDFLQPKKRQCLLKRCIRLLKDIDSHKIVRRPSAQGRETDSTGCSRFGSNYDKLAIHHVVAERRRREQMNEIFSALRALIPVSPKGRATVLQHTKEYVIHLKRRIEELERRNRELEELLSAQSARRGDQFHSILR